MRLPACFLGLFCALAACDGGGDEPLLVTLVDLPAGTTHLDMTGARLNEARTYRLKVVSRTDAGVEFTARLLDPVPVGMKVRVRGDRELLPRGSGTLLLTLSMPKGEGKFKGSVELSAVAASWRRTFSFAGDVVDTPLPGPRIAWKSVDLGTLRPGEQREFAVAIRSTGTEAIVIHDLHPDDNERLQVRVPDTMMIVPGGELQLSGAVKAPKAGGPFRTVIRIKSNATNVKGNVGVLIHGKVVPDYAPLPIGLGPVQHYPVQEPKFRVLVRGREGTKPFTIGAILGHERLFRIVERGSEKPAHEQTVVLQLKRDAPTDSEVQRLTVRIRLAPGGAEVMWPVALKLYPPIHPEPPRLHFGRVPRGAPVKKECRLATFANREFTVTSVRSRRGTFETELTHAPGLPWRVFVSIPNRTPAGLLQDTIIIETDDPDVPKILVPVKADLR